MAKGLVLHYSLVRLSYSIIQTRSLQEIYRALGEYSISKKIHQINVIYDQNNRTKAILDDVNLHESLDPDEISVLDQIWILNCHHFWKELWLRILRVGESSIF